MGNPTSEQDSSFKHDTDPMPDAQGQAALLLLESLIHSLIDNGTLKPDQVHETFNSAVEVKEDSADDQKESAAVLKRSLMLLRQMHASIETKVGRYDPD